MSRRFLGAGLLAGLVVVSGCAGRDEIGVERQWGDTMARLGMFGIYPPSEDVQIGDLYLHAPPRDSQLRNVARFSLVRMASLPREQAAARGRRRAVDWGLREELGWQQTEDRLAIQALPAPPDGSTPRSGVTRQRTVAPGQAPEAGRYHVGHADEALAPVRLRRAAMPGLVVGRVTEAALGGGATSGNFGAALGLGRQSRSVVELALNDVQDLALDTWRLSRQMQMHEAFLFDRVRVEDLLLYLSQLRPDLLGAACAGNQARLVREGVSVVVLGRVLYAGGIEYSFDRSAETAMRLAIDLQSTLARQPQAPQIPQLPANPQRVTPSATEPAAAAGERLAGLFAALTGETGGAGRAGVTTRLGIGTFGRLSLKTDFGRPVAVGAGGRLNYDFFQAMRGDYDTRPPRALPEEAFPPGAQTATEFRFRITKEVCRTNAPDALDVGALGARFGVPVGRQGLSLADGRGTHVTGEAPPAPAPVATGRGRPAADPRDVAPAAPLPSRAPAFYVGPNQFTR